MLMGSRDRLKFIWRIGIVVVFWRDEGYNVGKFGGGEMIRG